MKEAEAVAQVQMVVGRILAKFVVSHNDWYSFEDAAKVIMEVAIYSADGDLRRAVDFCRPDFVREALDHAVPPLREGPVRAITELPSDQLLRALGRAHELLMKAINEGGPEFSTDSSLRSALEDLKSHLGSTSSRVPISPMAVE